MIRKEKNGIAWLEFHLLSHIPEIRHAIFLRNGGASAPPFGTLNLSFEVGDKASAVLQNLQDATQILSMDSYVSLKQEHGKKVHRVDCSHFERKIGDSFATDIPGIGLLITHADCQAAIFYDPVNHAIANVHSGWRGSVQNIYAETVHFMQTQYTSKPENLLVCISPSLGPNHAEFIHYRNELPESFWNYQIKENYFDFWEISKMQLKNAGVLDKHIEIASLDTYEHPDAFFSYRRDKNTGRNGTFVGLIDLLHNNNSLPLPVPLAD